MNKMVREAIEALKELPEDRQATVARAFLDFASEDGVYHPSDYERADIEAGLAEHGSQA